MSNGPWTIYVCPTTDDPYTCRCDRDGDCDDRMFYVMPVPDDAAMVEAHLRSRIAELEAEVRTLDWYRAAWHRTISLVEGSSTGMLSTRAVFEALELPPLGPRS